MDDKEYIMYCIFSMEAVKAMGGNRGKLASMAGHAYLHAYWDAVAPLGQFPGRKFGQPDLPDTREQVRAYMNQLQKLTVAENYKNSEMAKKVTLKVDSTVELESLYEHYKDICGVSLVKDRGLTVFKEPTVVCLGLGPIERANVDINLKKLKVMI